MGAIREGRWDCDACGKVGIRGAVRVCPGCGQPRPEGVVFYLPKGEPEVADATAAQEAAAGADWYCEHCGAGNSNLRDSCKQCGAPRATSPSHKVTDYGLEEVPRSGDQSPQPELVETESSTRQAGPPGATGGESAWRKLGLPVGIAGGLLMVGLALFLLLRSPFTSVAVSGYSWERTIAVEQARTVTEEGWSLPPGARLLSQMQDIQTYVQVLDHYETKQRRVCESVRDGYEIQTYEECRTVQTGSETYVCGSRDLGNGYFEDIECKRPIYENRCTPATRQAPRYVKKCRDESYQDPIYRREPRYAARYTYEIERWAPSRTLRSDGQDHRASWPAVQLASNEREAGRTESYTVIFTDRRGKSYSYECPLEEWASYQEAEQLQVRINESGVVPR